MTGLRIRGLLALLGVVSLAASCLRMADFEPGCLSSSDCKSDEMCVDNKCVNSFAVACTVGGYGVCDYGFVCANSVCAPTAQGFCAESYECGIDQACVNWKCAASGTSTTPTTGCTVASQCASGFFCKNSTCTNVCVLDSECAQIGFDFCDDYSTCQFAECSDNEDCGTGYCIGGECI